jgi:hypothetical protein
MKELMSSLLANEANFLREKLKSLERDHYLNKIKTEEYELAVSEILEAIGKVSNVII